MFVNPLREVWVYLQDIYSVIPNPFVWYINFMFILFVIMAVITLFIKDH